MDYLIDIRISRTMLLQWLKRVDGTALLTILRIQVLQDTLHLMER